MAEKPYDSQNDNVRPAGEGAPPQSQTTPPGASDTANSPKTRTDPNTGEPSGGKPDKGG